MLNNTGPFRWWIHESFLDNKSMDRFVTDLIRMRGNTYVGPAGFGMATQNDAPMAAKATILGSVFMGVEMTCARCHDAPFQSVMPTIEHGPSVGHVLPQSPNRSNNLYRATVAPTANLRRR